MAAITQEQFDKMSENIHDDLASFPDTLGKTAQEKKVVAMAIEQTVNAIKTHGRIAGYGNVIKALTGQTPKGLARELTVTTAELAKGYEHGDNPKSVLAEA